MPGSLGSKCAWMLRRLLFEDASEPTVVDLQCSWSNSNLEFLLRISEPLIGVSHLVDHAKSDFLTLQYIVYREKHLGVTERVPKPAHVLQQQLLGDSASLASQSRQKAAVSRTGLIQLGRWLLPPMPFE